MIGKLKSNGIILHSMLFITLVCFLQFCIYNVTYAKEDYISGCVIIYDLNRASGMVPVDTEIYCSSSIVTAMAPDACEYIGHNFYSWSTDVSGDVIIYKPGDSFVIDKNITLYAVWEPEGINRNTVVDYHKAYLTGYPDGTIKPDDNLTRAEAAAMFSMLLNMETAWNIQSGIFNDVYSDSWYADAVMNAAVNGILKGYPDGSFRPYQPITRSEFGKAAVMLDEATGAGRSGSTDIDTGYWFMEYTSSAYADGWVTGDGERELMPDNPIKRCEAVTVINRMLNRKISIAGIHCELNTFTDLPTNHWAYVQVMEAAVGHLFRIDSDGIETWAY